MKEREWQGEGRAGWRQAEEGQGMPPAHSIPEAELLERFGSNAKTGLSTPQVQAALERFGPNAWSLEQKNSSLDILKRQISNPLILLLIVSAGVAAVVGHTLDAAGILLAAGLSVLFGFAQEYKAEAALGALQKLAAPCARCLRDGREMEIGARELVPGDILILSEGDMVPADARLLAGSSLRLDQSTLTGESMPIDKHADVCAPDTPLSERSCVVYAGTQVVRGSGRAVVFATGLEAEFGRIAQSLAGVQNEQTPLQKSLGELGSRIGQAAILLCIIFFLLGMWQAKYSWDELLLTSVSLAVAAIPEGLPTVLAITLGLGVQRMAAQKALVRKLQAVETLGCASVICTDKTGTLTANKMTVLRANLCGEEYAFGGGPYDLEAGVKRADGMPIAPDERARMQEALSIGVLCNEAGLLMEADGSLAGLRGDPTEGALLIAASKAGMDAEGMRNASPKLAEVAFDYHRKMMTEVRAQGRRNIACVKGAPERILERCTRMRTAQGEKALTPAMRAKLHALIHSYSHQALRTLALAEREVKGGIKDRRIDSSIEHDLTWTGLVGMMDPPRPEVGEALRLCRLAGIRVIMLTGDSPATAEVVARQIGILAGGQTVMSGEELDKLDDGALAGRLGGLAVLSRATPEHKFRIVRALQKGGEVVAVTGDGVNDAPSIKTADIGVAMGVGGTDVARGAADLVLTDNNFSSLVRAAETGRSIYENIRAFVRFQFTTNVAALSLMFITPLTGFGLPLLPLQILWINIIMDGPPALALGMEPGRPDAMSRPPRAKSAPFMSSNFLTAVGSSGAVMFLFTLMVFAYYAGSPEAAMKAKAVTMAFTVFVALQLVNAFNCRSSHLSAWHNMNGNRWLLLAVLVSLALQLAIIYTPSLQTMFSTAPLGWTDWGFVALAGALMLLKEEGVKRLMPSLTEY